MKTDLKKFWIALIIFNVIISLLSVSGVAYLIIKDSRPPATPTPTPTPTTTVTPAPTYNAPVSFKFNLANFPQMDGSTSNVPLRKFILCKLLSYECKWDQLSDYEDIITERGVSITANETDQALLKQKSVNSTTHNAYVKLINGETDVIFVATRPSADEQQLAQQKGVDFEITPIAMDALVFVVNQQNSFNVSQTTPVQSLTVQQLLDIYTGKTTNWSVLNGEDASISAYQREDNSGSQELMKSLVLKGIKPIGAPEMIIPGMIGLVNKVADNKFGIGYSVYYYEQYMVRNDKLRLLGVNGVVPSYQSLADGTYPLSAPVFVVTRKGLDVDSPAYNLSKWIMSEAGQKVVKDSGYVPAVK